LEGEWASEWDTSWYPSKAETRKFMDGSEERPVSKAWIWPLRSRKQSCTEEKAENAPSMEKWGVQIWAGMKTASGQASNVTSKRSRLESPRMGRPSERMLPMASRRRESSSAASSEGKRIRLCTLRVLPSCL